MRIAPWLALVTALVSPIGCGGSNSSAPTGPTTTHTAASIAPSLAAEINSSFIAAMRAGIPATALNRGGDESWLVMMLESLVARPLSAQAGFVGSCSRGGTVRVQYEGAAPVARAVTLANTPVVYSNCAYSLNGQDITASGTLMANGAWTAAVPTSPVALSGNLTVTQIGTIAINGSTGASFSGQVGGITIGTPVASFNGTYAGSGTGTGNFRLTPVLTDGVISGTLSTPPEAEVQASIPLTGTVSTSGQVTFSATDPCGGQVYSFTGSITGTQMSGTWSHPAAAGCSGARSGTFTATRQ